MKVLGSENRVVAPGSCQTEVKPLEVNRRRINFFPKTPIFAQKITPLQKMSQLQQVPPQHNIGGTGGTGGRCERDDQGERRRRKEREQAPPAPRSSRPQAQKSE